METGLDHELNIAINQNQQLKARILGMVFLGIVIFQVILITYLWNTSAVFGKFTRKSMVLVAPVLLLAMSAAEFYLSHLLSKRVQKNTGNLRYMHYVVAFLEASFPTFVLFFVASFLVIANDSEVDYKFLLNSPPMYFYFIFIILSALQLDFRLSLFVAVVSAVEYMALVLYFGYGQEPGTFYYGNGVGKGIFILIGGIMSGVVARKIKESVLSSLKSKNDLIYNLDNKVKEKTKEIEAQNILLAERNKDITDSIQYAKRIQHAKLPHRSEIFSSLANCFIFYKPKDIVSGDFYFFHKKNELVFIAAADCTGHGVPGAFMSMIGSEKLEDAVLQNNNASDILGHLNRGMKSALRQSGAEDSTRDGMDIALCSVNTKNSRVHYAGANRPLWIVRRNSPDVEEIKATKKAIGGLTGDGEIFEGHELCLEEGDVIYICTDGFADQFSGRNGKKLMTKRFKEILISIQDMPMAEQEKYLDDFIENWKAGTEQVDDILVIGIKF